MGKAIQNSHGARPVHQNHLHDQAELDQEVVKKDLHLSVGLTASAPSHGLMSSYIYHYFIMAAGGRDRTAHAIDQDRAQLLDA